MKEKKKRKRKRIWKETRNIHRFNGTFILKMLLQELNHIVLTRIIKGT